MDEILRFVWDGVQQRKGRWPDLAKASGVSYSWISKFGSGKFERQHPNLRTLQKLAAVLRPPQ